MVTKSKLPRRMKSFAAAGSIRPAVITGIFTTDLIPAAKGTKPAGLCTVWASVKLSPFDASA